ncbi:MAG: hypothetical protein H6680_06545 [Desulfobacteraceae bacterium]|nr:hypothetical protein [Desulfobacteraceae bacterium]
MKKFVVLMSAASLMLFAGCQKQTPEKAAEAHFKNSIKAHSGLKTETLQVTKVSEEGDKAVVNVCAELKYNEELNLVKEDGKWVVK